MRYYRLTVYEEEKAEKLKNYFNSIAIKVPESSYTTDLFSSFNFNNGFIDAVINNDISAVEINDKLFIIKNLVMKREGLELTDEEISSSKFFSIFFAHYPHYLIDVGFMYGLKDIKTGDMLYADFSLKKAKVDFSSKNYFPVNSDVSRRYVCRMLNLTFDSFNRKVAYNKIDNEMIRSVERCPLLVVNTDLVIQDKFKFEKEPVLVKANEIINARFKTDISAIQLERMLNSFSDRNMMKTNAESLKSFINSCFNEKIKLPSIYHENEKTEFNYSMFSHCRPEILFYNIGFVIDEIIKITGKNKKEIAFYLYQLVKDEKISKETYFKKSANKELALELRKHYRMNTLEELLRELPDVDIMELTASYLYADYLSKRIQYGNRLKNTKTMNKSADEKAQLMSGLDFVNKYSHELKLSREPLMSMNFEMNNNFKKDVTEEINFSKHF